MILPDKFAWEWSVLHVSVSVSHSVSVCAAYITKTSGQSYAGLGQTFFFCQWRTWQLPTKVWISLFGKFMLSCSKHDGYGKILWEILFAWMLQQIVQTFYNSGHFYVRRMTQTLPICVHAGYKQPISTDWCLDYSCKSHDALYYPENRGGGEGEILSFLC